MKITDLPRMRQTPQRYDWRNGLRRAILIVLCLLTVGAPTTTYALTDAQKNLLRSGVHYFDISGSDCSTTATTAAAIPLSGSDNVQKAFNFFKNKGLSDTVAAAITANLQWESSLDPKSNQVGGVGTGIAQWSNPGRWTELEKYAAQQGADKFSLGLQLDYLWKELNSGYADALKLTQKQSTPEDATAFFMGTASAGLYPGNVVDSVTSGYIAKYGRQGGFENPGSPHLDKRIGYAKTILKSYGNGVVTGSEAASGCVASGAVSCTNPASAGSSSTGLSEVRQNVVCLAQAEYQKWKSGQMGPGGDFKTYTQGNDEEWCADFVSWIYNQAGYPLGSASSWRVPAVSSVEQLGQENQKFTYHPAGNYTPVPGDIAIHTAGESHVNLVVSVNQSKQTMVTIGGNEGGISVNSQSLVNEDHYNSYTDEGITGFVSPKQ